ncbi:WG repeat-containing protein [Spirosoma soli]|uniref:WG repeat-containing protein n=1 Tax=Spirosoma soli TaxID=1770529 RepID=A0ABW5LYB1_9BACT
MLLSLLLPSVRLFAQTNTSPNEAWLTKYDECQDYGEVYVVKKITKPCRSYQTFLTDKNGRKLTPAYRDIGDFEEGLAEFVPMKLNQQGHGLHGFIDKQGKVIVEPKYISTDRFRQGKTWVIYPADTHYGLSYIDKTGKEVYKISIQHYSNDYLIHDATIDYECNHDTKEDVLWWRGSDFFILNFNFTPFVTEQIQRSKYVTAFKYHGKFGIIDHALVLKVPVALDAIDVDYTYSGQGLQRVQYGTKYGYVSPVTGELIVPFDYSDTRKPTNGLFWVKKRGKWGCIDKTGKLRIPHLYDEATGFTVEDRSAVAIDGKFGHIDKSGKVRTPLTYDFASYYQHGLSMVRMNNKYGFIDTSSRLIIPLIYDEAFPFDHVTTLVERYWLRYELSLDGETHFVGFSYKLKALFIIAGLLIFIWLSRLVKDLSSKFRAKLPRR